MHLPISLILRYASIGKGQVLVELQTAIWPIYVSFQYHHWQTGWKYTKPVPVYMSYLKPFLFVLFFFLVLSGASALWSVVTEITSSDSTLKLSNVVRGYSQINSKVASVLWNASRHTFYETRVYSLNFTTFPPHDLATTLSAWFWNFANFICLLDRWLPRDNGGNAMNYLLAETCSNPNYARSTSILTLNLLFYWFFMAVINLLP